MNLYELTEQWTRVLELAEDGEDPQAIKDTLEGIEGAIEEKADGYAKVIKNLEGQADILKAEKERLALRESALRNNAKSLKQRLEESMILCGKKKFKTSLFSFGIQKNAPSLSVEDEHRLMEYLNLHKPDLLQTTIAIKKRELVDLLKGGGEVEYAELKQGESLRIR